MAWSDHLRRGIFVLLLTPVVSVLTAFAVSAAGVADDQGMAGPATVLVWAAMAALIAFVGGFFLARQIPSARLVQLNLLLAILAGILAVYVGFRLSRQASATPTNCSSVGPNRRSSTLPTPTFSIPTWAAPPTNTLSATTTNVGGVNNSPKGCDVWWSMTPCGSAPTEPGLERCGPGGATRRSRPACARGRPARSRSPTPTG